MHFRNHLYFQNRFGAHSLDAVDQYGESQASISIFYVTMPQEGLGNVLEIRSTWIQKLDSLSTMNVRQR